MTAVADVEGWEEPWEDAELIAALDPGIAPRLIAAHPDSGWCSTCHARGPCLSRLLGEAAARAGGRATAHGVRPAGGRR